MCGGSQKFGMQSGGTNPPFCNARRHHKTASNHIRPEMFWLPQVLAGLRVILRLRGLHRAPFRQVCVCNRCPPPSLLSKMLPISTRTKHSQRLLRMTATPNSFFFLVCLKSAHEVGYIIFSFPFERARSQCAFSLASQPPTGVLDLEMRVCALDPITDIPGSYLLIASLRQTIVIFAVAVVVQCVIFIDRRDPLGHFLSTQWWMCGGK